MAAATSLPEYTKEQFKSWRKVSLSPGFKPQSVAPLSVIVDASVIVTISSNLPLSIASKAVITFVMLAGFICWYTFLA